MFRRTISATAIQLALVLALLGGITSADDKLLEETVKFTGSKVPALVVGVVRNGKTTVYGFGETSEGSAKPPDGNTLLRVGSLTKAFTGQVLASLVASKKLGFTDRLQERLGWNVIVPQRNGHEIRLIDLATHTSGLPEKWKENLAPPTIRSPR